MKNESKEKAPDFELASEELQEILGAVPPSVVKYGATLLFLFLGIIILFSFFIKYPDTVNSEILLVSTPPSATIVAKQTATIERILTSNEASVNKDDVIIVLKSTSNYNDTQILNKKLQLLSQQLLTQSVNLPDFSGKLELGDIQIAFVSFLAKYNDYRQYLKLNIIGLQIESLKIQLSARNALYRNLSTQLINKEKIFSLLKADFLRDSMLVLDLSISRSEFEKSSSNILQAKNDLESLRANIINSQTEIAEVKFKILDLEAQKLEKTNQLKTAVEFSIKELRNAINNWENQFLIKSPIDGKVSFTNYWALNQNIEQGKAICKVVPKNHGQIIGRLKFPLTGSAKVLRGQTVIVKLYNYPYLEYGFLKGKIESISLTPDTEDGQSYYTAEVSFPEGLLTSYNKRLPFSQEMQGSGEIITKKINLFERIVRPFEIEIGTQTDKY
nr:HlyD family secretion protein [uncultured Pedobacter sp.]